MRDEVEKCTIQFRNIKTTTIKPISAKSTKQQNTFDSFDLRGKENFKYYSKYQTNQAGTNYDFNQESINDDNNNDRQDLDSSITTTKCESTLNVNSDTETPCCKILRKPIEKVLIRYERPPIDYLSSVDQQFFSLSNAENLELKKIIKKEMMATLSRYLHHERWIWTPENLSKETGKTISLSLLGKVLAELLR